jgi:PAT family beta-lactamase induction signal transducer AmpG
LPKIHRTCIVVKKNKAYNKKILEAFLKGIQKDMSRFSPAAPLSKQSFLFVLLGFSSGLPFLLILSTLSAWLMEAGITRTNIGLFVLVTLPYTFKFFISPWIDSFYLPYLTKRLGQRRSCALVSQLFLMLFLLGLGMTDPSHQLWLTAVMAFFVSFFAAAQDLVLEAYRIETTTKEARGIIASAICFGFRLGLLVSGAGALYLSSFLSWYQVYKIMALCVLIGVVGVLLSSEPQGVTFQILKKNRKTSALSIPLHFFWSHGVRRLFKYQKAWVILAFIFFYKLGDTTLNFMNIPFLLSQGYSKVEIAEIAKFLGTTAMILGGFGGGGLLVMKGLLKSLRIAIGLQILSCLLMTLQAYVGYHVPLLIFVMGTENFASGLATTIFMAYIAALCKPPFTATQYAFLASFGSCARILWSMLGGALADILPWQYFFSLVTLGCLPAVFILWRLSPSFEKIWALPSPSENKPKLKELKFLS